MAQDDCSEARSIWPDIKDSGSVDALRSFAKIFSGCPIYAGLAQEKINRLAPGGSNPEAGSEETAQGELTLDDETCLTMASVPLQHEDFLGVRFGDIMVEPALEVCGRAVQSVGRPNPEVRAAYARVLRKAKNYEAAAKHARMAAENGSALGATTLSAAYENGQGVKKDQDLSLLWLEKAADTGFPMAQLNLAYTIIDDDPERAVELFTHSAEAGYGSSQDALGDIYREGKIAPQDLAAALFWYGQAIEYSQNTDAMYWSALILSGDYGDYPADYERALELYERAADAGDKWAQHNVASMYLHGKGTYPDTDRATHYFSLAAEQGHVKSMRKYGRLLHEGGDPAQAIHWYQRAASKGDEVAEKLLAKILGD
ncbi:tetratricopeptide repeat protein [Ruegeria atlantica]|uniref:tetratricopeptide repeat protein n=1 Tax=Ruegeria atlantica TaxID=81569 RepID=UPI0024943228|nr:tetratricopeptide repeat protein [Ruegeria atlantica]